MNRRNNCEAAAAWIATTDPIPVVAHPGPRLSGSARFPAGGEYVETYWLPVLGPSATWAYRRLAAAVELAGPSGTWIPKWPFAQTLGVPGRSGRHANINRTLHRLVLFGAATIDHDTLAIRTTLPALDERNLRRLPAHLLAQHAANHPDLTPPPDTITPLDLVNGGDHPDDEQGDERDGAAQGRCA